jgi:hypothetical protein
VRLSSAELQRSLSDLSWAQERLDELGDAWAEGDPPPPEKAPYFSIEKSCAAAAGAAELAELYACRWTSETICRHIKIEQRDGRTATLRSNSPVMIEQELWAALCVCQATRELITDTAHAHRLPPDHLSFKNALNAARRTVGGDSSPSPPGRQDPCGHGQPRPPGRPSPARTRRTPRHETLGNWLPHPAPRRTTHQPRHLHGQPDAPRQQDTI